MLSKMYVNYLFSLKYLCQNEGKQQLLVNSIIILEKFRLLTLTLCLLQAYRDKNHFKLLFKITKLVKNSLFGTLSGGNTFPLSHIHEIFDKFSIVWQFILEAFGAQTMEDLTVGSKIIIKCSLKTCLQGFSFSLHSSGCKH